jgi:hypothetical protein
VLVVQFLELEGDEILDLATHDTTDPATASAIQLATSEFLRSSDRAHVHSIIYRGHGWLTPTALPGVQEQGPAYFFTNRANPHAVDPRYRLFSEGT